MWKIHSDSHAVLLKMHLAYIQIRLFIYIKALLYIFNE